MTMDSDLTPGCVDNPAEQRFELRLGDEVASSTHYRPEGDLLVFDHTETPEEFRGRGYAEKVVGFAMREVRERGLKIRPDCQVVRNFLQENEEFGELVVEP
jgi:uncharacterized protein